MFGLDTRRQDLRADVEDWLYDHPDPADPLTMPVRLLLRMFIVGTNRGAVFVAGLAGATLAMVIGGLFAFAAIRANDHVTVPAGEREAMQEWINSGEASRMMRCHEMGLEFADGRCHTVKGGGWLIPLAARQALPELPPAVPTDDADRVKRHRGGSSPSEGAANTSAREHHRSGRTFPNPFES